MDILLPGQAVFQHRAFDIRESRIRLVAQTNLYSGLTVALRFVIAYGIWQVQMIQTPAVVVYSTFSGKKGGFKVGLRFSELTASAQSALKRYLVD